MREAVWTTAMIAGMWLSSGVSQAAESKPINELPSDLVRWSTMWTEVPKQMYGVGQAEGPVAAMTWGPVRGTVMLVNATTKALWDVAKSDTRRVHHSRDKNPSEAILRYEF